MRAKGWYNDAMDSIVALDIETTGLDPSEDAIIEIGAVRFNENRIEAEWSTLINPGRAIPPFITQLTGITNTMVQGAPRIEEVLNDLQDFVGNVPILGHNVSFDLSFLRKLGLFAHNESIDTYDLAAVLLPSAGRYNLAALGQNLGIPLPATHRALDDAKVTQGVYSRLIDIGKGLPLNVLAEIVRLGEGVEWGAQLPFQRILHSRSSEVVDPQEAAGVKPEALWPAAKPLDLDPLEPKDEYLPVDSEEAAALLEHGGKFSKQFPDFEYRPEQVEMLRAVSEALSNSGHLMVEAGTGTGKSMAYLAPAALWATKNESRVLISTNTINLQDQLINKDIPDIKKVLSNGLRATVLKGRRNYLCPRRLEALRRKTPETRDELRVLAKLLVWLQDSKSGDLNEINITGPGERAVWGRVSAEDEGCSSETCVRRMGGICPFHQARQSAHYAHIVIVNHALLLADVATGNRVLPNYEHLIVDEGHHLEDATTNALSFRLTQAEVDRILRELGGKNAGILGEMTNLTRNGLEPGETAIVNDTTEKLTDKAFQFQNQLKGFFQTINQFLYEQREGQQLGSYAHQERILPSTRAQPHWLEVETSWEETQFILRPVLENLEKAGKILVEMMDNEIEAAEDVLGNITGIYRRLKEIDENVNGMVFEPSDNVIYWVEIHPQRKQIALHAAPLHIGALMEKHLWHEKESVILTSATLTAANEFDYIRDRLNAADAESLALGSPFEYESAAMVYIPNNIPEPSDRNGHQRAIENNLMRLASATGGRTLALFTSYAQLQRTSKRISPALAEKGIQVYEQGQGASAHALLETFKQSDGAVLLGTRAFWEGVDVPGEALSVLAIVKLPFDVPSDPIVAARSETFDEPFYQYSIPEAILRFRQGFGRLIRTQQDRGVVAILDRRVLSKKYGQLFIDSLPECTVKVGPIEKLPEEAVKWLGI